MNTNAVSSPTGINQPSNVNWELIKDCIRDLALSSAKTTITSCERWLGKHLIKNPDEVVRLEIYNNIGAVNDLIEQLRLLGMPDVVFEAVKDDRLLHWTPQDIARSLSRKARRRWLFARFVIKNGMSLRNGIPDFDVDDFSQF